MPIIITSHAKKRMIDRGINFKQIQQTIEMPDYTVKKEQKTEAYKRHDGKMLKVVYAVQDKYIKVITLMWK
ncbi:MAG: DUF4258 domain-containing protein [Nanoarchaeota archaeon]|nr:DUF4258 domain-containing protein [Nanoarchaeota archaeon]